MDTGGIKSELETFIADYWKLDKEDCKWKYKDSLYE